MNWPVYTWCVNTNICLYYTRIASCSSIYLLVIITARNSFWVALNSSVQRSLKQVPYPVPASYRQSNAKYGIQEDKFSYHRVFPNRSSQSISIRLVHLQPLLWHPLRYKLSSKTPIKRPQLLDSSLYPIELYLNFYKIKMKLEGHFVSSKFGTIPTIHFYSQSHIHALDWCFSIQVIRNFYSNLY